MTDATVVWRSEINFELIHKDKLIDRLTPYEKVVTTTAVGVGRNYLLPSDLMWMSIEYCGVLCTPHLVCNQQGGVMFLACGPIKCTYHAYQDIEDINAICNPSYQSVKQQNGSHVRQLELKNKNPTASAVKVIDLTNVPENKLSYWNWLILRVCVHCTQERLECKCKLKPRTVDFSNDQIQGCPITKTTATPEGSKMWIEKMTEKITHIATQLGGKISHTTGDDKEDDVPVMLIDMHSFGKKTAFAKKMKKQSFDCLGVRNDPKVNMRVTNSTFPKLRISIKLTPEDDTPAADRNRYPHASALGGPVQLPIDGRMNFMVNL
jgi:hypothetical protein